MKTTLLKLCEEQNLFSCNNIISSFIASYFYGVALIDDQEQLTEIQSNLTQTLLGDKDLKKLIKSMEYNIDFKQKYTTKYYEYYLAMMELFSRFLTSLNQTLMPGTNKSSVKVAYRNYHYFFICYSDIKKIISENLSKFTLEDFEKATNNIIIFYYGYRAYITQTARDDIEYTIKTYIAILTDKKFLKLLYKKEKTLKEHQYLHSIKHKMYVILLNLYSLMNQQHSLYNLNPKIRKKVYNDTTLI